MIQPIRQGLHILFHLSNVQGPPDLFLCGARLTHGHIFPDGTGINSRLLQNTADLPPDAGTGKLQAVPSVQENSPGSGPPEAQ